MQPKQAAAEEDVKAPAAEPTDEEIHGVDVLEIENAVKALWKAGIYAESSMGCTGPVIKFAKHNEEKSKKSSSRRTTSNIGNKASQKPAPKSAGFLRI